MCKTENWFGYWFENLVQSTDLCSESDSPALPQSLEYNDPPAAVW